MKWLRDMPMEQAHAEVYGRGGIHLDVPSVLSPGMVGLYAIEPGDGILKDYLPWKAFIRAREGRSMYNCGGKRPRKAIR